jgi:deazaflavin-dependent oxidoreductase (nitroreductase family)
VLLLTTTGRVSGQERTTPLIHREDGDRWVVIASKGGAPDDPRWFKNLEAEPEATIQVKAERIPVRASVAQGPERERLWARMTEVWPAYGHYQQKTDRQIPVVVLERR